MVGTARCAVHAAFSGATKGCQSAGLSPFRLHPPEKEELAPWLQNPVNDRIDNLRREA